MQAFLTGVIYFYFSAMLCSMIVPLLQTKNNPIRDKRNVFCLLTHVFFKNGTLHIAHTYYQFANNMQTFKHTFSISNVCVHILQHTTLQVNL